MTNPSVAYFFKKFYRNIIKWWYVIYSPIKRVISYSDADKEYTQKLEAEKEKKQKERVQKYCAATGQPVPSQYQDSTETETATQSEMTSVTDHTQQAPTTQAETKVHIEDVNYNETTGSFSGLYGQKPVDASTQSMLDEIMGNNTNSQNNIDSLFSNDTPNPAPKETPKKEEVVLPPEQDDIIKEANEIYERLMREAAEDEAKKQAEIEAAKMAQAQS